MDLDDDELEATRKLHGVGKEKTADEMFEELGYRKLNREEMKNRFEKEYFDLLECYYEKPTHVSTVFYNDKTFDVISSKNMQELQAINKKVQELGWNIK